MDSKPRLFQARTSSASWRIRIALALKAIRYEPIWIDLYDGDHLNKNYGEMTPTQQVPCLEIDGQRLFQSVAIIEYLDETHPKPALLPGDTIGRARVRGLTEIINSVIQPLHNLAVRERLQKQFGASEIATKAWCRYWIEHRFKGLDRALEKTRGQYSVGDSVTMADVFLFPQVETARRFDADLSGFTAVESVMVNLLALTPFSQSYAGRE